jgi:hypothetical protein
MTLLGYGTNLCVVVSVRGEIKYRGVIVKHMLRAVAVVHVPVHDQYAPNAHLLLGNRCRHRHIVEEAKPLRTVSFSMMSGGAYDSRTVAHCSVHYRASKVNSCSRR